MQALLQKNDLLANRYRVVNHVANGGMSVIYLVEDTDLGNKKLILKSMCVNDFPGSNQQEIIDGFKREAIILANLNHPQLPRVIDYFISDNSINFYLIMDYIEGKDLNTELFEKGKFTEKEVIEISIEILGILEYLHNEGIIYRDLKPSNIMRRIDNTIMLIDFGIAKRIISYSNIVSAQSMTTQTLVGTPGFAAREQHFGKAEPRSDLHSLAVTMYQLLTNINLDPTKTLGPIKNICPDISYGLACIIDKNTDHRIDFRDNNAFEMKQSITKIIIKIKNNKTFCSQDQNRSNMNMCACNQEEIYLLSNEINKIAMMVISFLRRTRIYKKYKKHLRLNINSAYDFFYNIDSVYNSHQNKFVTHLLEEIDMDCNYFANIIDLDLNWFHKLFLDREFIIQNLRLLKNLIECSIHPVYKNLLFLKNSAGCYNELCKTRLNIIFNFINQNKFNYANLFIHDRIAHSNPCWQVEASSQLNYIYFEADRLFMKRKYSEALRCFQFLDSHRDYHLADQNTLDYCKSIIIPYLNLTKEIQQTKELIKRNMKK